MSSLGETRHSTTTLSFGVQHDCIKTAAYQRRSSSKTGFCKRIESNHAHRELHPWAGEGCVEAVEVEEAVETAAEVKDAVRDS